MSQFYADIQGSRGAASRMGGKDGGIRGHIRGWSVGVRVHGRHVDGEDIFDVALTGGSNSHSAEKHIGTARLVDGEPVFEKD